MGNAAPFEAAIRVATARDAAAIAQVLHTAFEPYRQRYTPQAYLDTVLTTESVLERLASMTVLVAVDAQGRVVGTIAGGLLSASEGHLRGMGVLPEWHGRGIAQRLLQRIEDHLIRAGCALISLDTTEPLQRAMHFYHRNGYRRSGKIADFFGMPLIEHIKNIRRA